MNEGIKRIIGFLRTRLFRNILFWLIFAGAKYATVDNATQTVFLTLGLLIFAALAYGNNFYFVPKWLSQKKYKKYFAIVLPLVFATTVLYVFLVKLLTIHYPSIAIIEVSIISSPVDKNVSLLGIITDNGFQTYFWTIIEWIFSFTLLWYLNDYAIKAQRAIDAEAKQMEAELNFLKSQINPHFLFNTFNNLYALSLKKSDLAPEIILKLSSILRYILYESNVPLISFNKEKEMMQAYIDVELLRLNQTQGMVFEMECDEPLSVPPLLWLPILENVFKHSRSVNQSTVYYSFVIDKKVLHVVSTNSFVAQANAQATSGIGLTNLKKRLELLYPNRYKLTTAVVGNEFTLQLKLNLVA